MELPTASKTLKKTHISEQFSINLLNRFKNTAENKSTFVAPLILLKNAGKCRNYT